MKRLSIALVLGIATVLGLAIMPSGEVDAANCNGTCMRVDAIAGGGIDASASVGGTFGVDIVLQNTGNSVTAMQFTLKYSPAVIRASAPVPSGGAVAQGWDCSLLPPKADADGNPQTGDATLACFSYGQTIGDGPFARVNFQVVGTGSSNLHLSGVTVGNNLGIEVASCDPVITNEGGGCTDARVTTGGTPPPPPPPPPGNDNICAVSFAIDGETVKCADGRRFRFIGVGSPLGTDPGTEWATAVTQWFLAGKTVLIEDDVNKFDQFGQRYGYPIMFGADGNIYNMSALLIFVGMARHTPDPVNKRHDAWFGAAQTWARVACWNMWAAGNPWAGESGCR